MHFQREVPYQGHGRHSMWSSTWPITRGVGSSSGTNSCFQIQPLFRRRCKWVDPWANCWASRPWVPLISLSTPPGIIKNTIATAKTLGMLIFTVHPYISSALHVDSGQRIVVSLVHVTNSSFTSTIIHDPGSAASHLVMMWFVCMTMSLK